MSPRLTPEIKEDIIRRKMNRETSAAIADALGISRNSVIGCWNRHKKHLPADKIPRPDPKKKGKGWQQSRLGAWVNAGPSEAPKRSKKAAKVCTGEDAARAVKFMDLGPRGCQFEIHDLGKIAIKDFRFCGADIADITPPYCERHLDIAFTRRRRAAA